MSFIFIKTFRSLARQIPRDSWQRIAADTDFKHLFSCSSKFSGTYFDIFEFNFEFVDGIEEVN